MSIEIRSYTSEKGYSDDFRKICDFLIRINQKKVITPNYLWARWVWQFGPYMNMDNLSHIGVAEDKGKIQCYSKIVVMKAHMLVLLQVFRTF